MEKFKNYNISFSGLSLGEHAYSFKITQPFFDLFDFEQDFQKPAINLTVQLNKKATFLGLHLVVDGKVEVFCDITGERFMLPIKSETKIIVKFGEDYDFSDDEIWMIPHGEHQINIAQIVYELTLLAVPNKRIHPSVKDGTSDSEMIELLEKYSVKEINIKQKEIDPRWDKLKNIQIDSDVNNN